MTAQAQVFVSAINGAKFDVQNGLTADLLSKNEKKEIIHKAKTAPAQAGKSKAKTAKPDLSDNEQEIA